MKSKKMTGNIKAVPFLLPFFHRLCPVHGVPHAERLADEPLSMDSYQADGLRGFRQLYSDVQRSAILAGSMEYHLIRAFVHSGDGCARFGSSAVCQHENEIPDLFFPGELLSSGSFIRIRHFLLGHLHAAALHRICEFFPSSAGQQGRAVLAGRQQAGVGIDHKRDAMVDGRFQYDFVSRFTAGYPRLFV